MGSLGGPRVMLDEPLCIGRSLVCCVSGGMFPIPDEVAAALFFFRVLPWGIVVWRALGFHLILERL